MRDGGRVAEKILKAHEFEFSAFMEPVLPTVACIPGLKIETWGTHQKNDCQ
jgi:hypothetical protein